MTKTDRHRGDGGHRRRHPRAAPAGRPRPRRPARRRRPSGRRPPISAFLAEVLCRRGRRPRRTAPHPTHPRSPLPAHQAARRLRLRRRPRRSTRPPSPPWPPAATSTPANPVVLLGDSGTGKTPSAHRPRRRRLRTRPPGPLRHLRPAGQRARRSRRRTTPRPASSPATAASICSASTSSATSSSTPAAPSCCSRSSPNARRRPRIAARLATCRSANGARSSPTPASSPPSSTASPSTPTSSRPAPRATDSAPPAPAAHARRPRRQVGPNQTSTVGPIRVDIPRRLERLAALCPDCHEVKHAGLASKRGGLSAVIAHLAEANGWSPEDAGLYLEAVFETWAARSRQQWTLDISLLSTRYGIRQCRPKRKRTRLIPSVLRGQGEQEGDHGAVLPVQGQLNRYR